MNTRSAAIAFINNSITPYRLHLHRRLVREISEIDLWSLFTHEISNAPWRLKAPEEIRPVFFGPGEESLAAGRVTQQAAEWSKAGRVLNWLEAHRPAAVVLGGYNDIGRLRIVQWCNREAIPCLLFGDSNIRCERLPRWKALVKRLVLPVVLRRFSAVLCCGSVGEEYYVRYGTRPGRVFRFPYEADYDMFGCVHPERIHEARRRFRLREDRRYLIYAGRFAPAKRIDLLLEAFRRVAAARPSWDLILAGDGELRAKLESMLSPQMHSRTVWTGFINDTGALAAVYAAAHVAVMPSDYEPWGVAVTEAATRMPVVASSVVGAAVDLIVDGRNGRIFRSGEADALAQCLLDVTDEGTLSRMTSAAPQLFLRWRSSSDPVNGLRRALRSVEVL